MVSSRGCGCSVCLDQYCASKVSIFQHLDDAGLEEISRLIGHISIRKGETVFLQGDILNCLYIINKGSVKAFTHNREGREQILYVLTEGDFFGELSLLKEDTFEFNVMALEDSLLCILSQKDFRTILAESPTVRDQVLVHAFERIKSLEKMVRVLTNKDVDVRLAVLISNLAAGFGESTDEGTLITLSLSREDMAAYLGLTRETVSRRLSSFQSEGILKLQGNRKVIVRDLDRLKEMIDT